MSTFHAQTLPGGKLKQPQSISLIIICSLLHLICVSYASLNVWAYGEIYVSPVMSFRLVNQSLGLSLLFSIESLDSD